VATFAHIINPVSASDNAELNRIQQITFCSITNAIEYSKGKVGVKIYSTQYDDAVSVVPPNFSVLTNLTRGVSDIASFKSPRKLPLIKDILDCLNDNSDAEYLIYTNLDICLMPQFYSAINDYVSNGHDAFVINRRRVSGKYNSVIQLNEIYSEIGAVHTGYDTFVFKRSLYKKFIMKNVCLGIPKAGNDLFYNIFCFAENPKLFTDKHLTIHIGMELSKDWGDSDYNAHNANEIKALMKELAPLIDITKFPGSERNFFVRQFKWLMNPTFHYPTMMKMDLKQLGKKRKQRENKIPKEVKQKYLEWLIKFINFD
jgi:hypothetical protein